MRLFIQHTSFFQTLLISSISLQYVMALTASSIFYIPPFPETGNCQGFDMDRVVTETNTLAANAIDVINMIIGDNILISTQNMVYLGTAYALWGTKVAASLSGVTLTSQGKYILHLAQC
jgi:hypothetical protein